MKKIVIIIILLSSFNLFAQKLIPYRKGNLWGYSKEDKTIVVKPEFDKITYFNDNQPGIVVKNKKVGLMSAKGELLIPVKYIYMAKDGKGYTAISDSGRVYFDENFKKIDSPIEEDTELMSPRQPYDFSEANGKKGLKGKPPVYDEMFEFIVNGNRYFTALKDGKYGVINENEKIVIPFIYDFLSSIYNTNITQSNTILLTGIGKSTLNGGFLKFDGKFGLHSLFLNNKFESLVYLEPKYDLVYLPNTNQYIDNDQFVCVQKDGKERIWNIKTGIEYYED
jgi:hypothetical protein